MSYQLNDPRVMKKLCDNISHTINTLHYTGMISSKVRRLVIEVTDVDKHHFTVQWGDKPEELDTWKAVPYVFDEYSISIVGAGHQSRAIAALVAETILSSLNMVQEATAERP
mgnify:CR=1 FL=1